MFERFTSEARRTVVAAQVEAAHRSDTYIGAEHLLVAVLDPAGGGLDDLGTDAAEIRRTWRGLEEDALHSVGLVTTPDLLQSPSKRRRRHLPFTGSARQVLENALREAIALGDRQIRAEHIALAVVALPPTERATRILTKAGLDRDRFRKRVCERLARAV